jgi:hypothetical protein
MSTNTNEAPHHPLSAAESALAQHRRGGPCAAKFPVKFPAHSFSRTHTHTHMATVQSSRKELKCKRHCVHRYIGAASNKIGGPTQDSRRAALPEVGRPPQTVQCSRGQTKEEEGEGKGGNTFACSVGALYRPKSPRINSAAHQPACRHASCTAANGDTRHTPAGALAVAAVAALSGAAGGAGGAPPK